jgi:hypothetical protein
MSQRRDEAKARIQEIIDMDGEETLRQKYARGDFTGPAEKEARYRIEQFDKASVDGRHQDARKTTKAGNLISFVALVVAILALLWAVYG